MKWQWSPLPSCIRRFEEVAPSEEASTCIDHSKCIGGISRLYKLITEMVHNQPNALLLNAGDNYQGTLWYNVFKWNVTQYFLNKLPFDAYTLGNHEFDNKVEGLIPFLKSVEAPFVVANIDDSDEPNIQGLYKKSIVVTKNGVRIGIIGVIISSVDRLSSTGNLRFFKESESVNKEADRLVNEENVDTVIVISHCGYQIDKEIAKNATEKIGLIVGGHSHSFLWTGDNPPGPDTPKGEYPTVVETTDGRTVLIVQASAYTKYLGNITVFYDNDGNVVDWDGKPIFLNNSLERDRTIDEELQPWLTTVREHGKEILGETLVALSASECFCKECNLGSFIADAMVQQFEGRVPIAIHHAGGIRTSLKKGNITYENLVVTLPFESTIDTGLLQGKYLLEALENGAKFEKRFRGIACSNGSPDNYNILQVSGIKVVINTTKPEGERIESVKVRISVNPSVYEDLNENGFYSIAFPDYLGRFGGDSFTMISNNIQDYVTGDLDTEVVGRYIKQRSPIVQEAEERIIMIY